MSLAYGGWGTIDADADQDLSGTLLRKPFGKVDSSLVYCAGTCLRCQEALAGRQSEMQERRGKGSGWR